MTWVRDSDRWFIDEVLPHAEAYHAQAMRWAVDRDAACDIVQDAYARIVAYPRWRELEDPRAYVLMVVRNVAIDRLRQARVAPFDRSGDAKILVAMDEGPDPYQVVAAKRDLEAVRGAIRNLPAQCRRVVEMRKFEDCAPREIAETLRISVSTVEKHLVKGLRMVSAALAQPVGTYESTPQRKSADVKDGSGRRMAGQPRRGHG